ncbi:hypothetical protein [Streptomyces sp. NPDC054866]
MREFLPSLGDAVAQAAERLAAEPASSGWARAASACTTRRSPYIAKSPADALTRSALRAFIA